MRDLFVFHVHKDTSDKNLSDYILSKGIIPLDWPVCPIQTQSSNHINYLCLFLTVKQLLMLTYGLRESE